MDGRLTLSAQSSKEGILRLAKTSVAVVTKTAAILGVGNETPVDTNGNGYYDTLQLDITVHITTSGEYNLIGSLADPPGPRPARDPPSPPQPRLPFINIAPPPDAPLTLGGA